MGNLRTALFNWLFARRYGGTFIVRVEDTDRERYVEGAVESILESLRWLGIDWDEGPEVGGTFGPYFQSQRLDLYVEAARRLVNSGHAYRCYCSRERLEQVRAEQRRRRQATRYDRHCRDITSSAIAQYESKGTVPVVRFRTPTSGQTGIRDIVRGEVRWQNELSDDFILLKSDGYPTYHLANVLDDHHMGISHVLRAEEWLPSSPRHLLLYEALGFEPPAFAHLPMILGPDRSKLSKRHGTTSVLRYRDAGYLPEAMINFMALLGWAYDDRTVVMSREFLVEHFALERIVKSSAVFDREKLLWMNGVYIRQLAHEELASQMLPFLQRRLRRGTNGVDRGYLTRIVPLVQERLRTLDEAPDITSYFFRKEVRYELSDLVQKGMTEESAQAATHRSLQILGELADFDVESIEGALRAAAEELGLSGRQLFGLLRIAVTGRMAAPPLFQTMDVLGREICLKRLEKASARLKAAGNPPPASAAGPDSPA